MPSTWLARTASKPEDVDRAVAAARRAFEAPSWADITPYQRSRVLLQIADVIEAHARHLLTFARSRAFRSGPPGVAAPGRPSCLAGLLADLVELTNLRPRATGKA
jgi:hypothetical protein